MLQQIYGENTISCPLVFEWHKRFQEDSEDVKDDSRNGRPSTSRTEVNVDRVRQVMCSKCRLTVWRIASQLDVKKDSFKDHHQRFGHVWKVMGLGVLGIQQFLVIRSMLGTVPRAPTTTDITTGIIITMFNSLFSSLARSRYLFSFHWPIGLSVCQWSGRLGFNPRSSHTIDSKMVLDAALLNTQHYKVWIKGKVGQSRERSCALPYTLI